MPAPASAMFNRRWTSASVIDSDYLCWGGLSSPGMWFHFQVDVLVFLGFKGGLGNGDFVQIATLSIRRSFVCFIVITLTSY